MPSDVRRPHFYRASVPLPHVNTRKRRARGARCVPRVADVPAPGESPWRDRPNAPSVEGKPRRHRHEPTLEVANVIGAMLLESNVSGLHHILGIRVRAEDAVGNPDEPRT